MALAFKEGVSISSVREGGPSVTKQRNAFWKWSLVSPMSTSDMSRSPLTVVDMDALQWTLLKKVGKNNEKYNKVTKLIKVK